MKPFNRLAVAMLAANLAAPVFAQQKPATVAVDAATRHAVIDELGRQLKSNYVFPEVAAKVASGLVAREASGAYANATDAETFRSLLASDLRSLGDDLHLNIRHDPDFSDEPGGTKALPSHEDVGRARKAFASRGYGIDSVRRLEGNVGYLEVRGFGPAEFVGEAMTAAMKLLDGTDALILDLRRNGGGEPDSVTYLLSHFFALGDSRHLNDIYSRTEDATRQYWTNPAVTVRYEKPIYVLTSRRTFSGGEEAAYDLQTQKRATLVGEVTGGGANPGDGYSLTHDFVAFIPNGRSINPVTKTNWEHVGVKPDIAVPAADAQKTAHAAILKRLAATSTNPDEKAELQALTLKVESGHVEIPNYTPPRR